MNSEEAVKSCALCGAMPEEAKPSSRNSHQVRCDTRNCVMLRFSWVPARYWNALHEAIEAKVKDACSRDAMSKPCQEEGQK